VERLSRISFGGLGSGRRWLGKAVLPDHLSEVMGCVLSCRFLGLATSAVHDHHGGARSCNFHPALHSRQTDPALVVVVVVVAVKRLVGSHPGKLCFVLKRLSGLMLRCHFGFCCLVATAACSLRSRWCLDKLVGVKWPASQPDQPHCFQDLALGV
jgi:hypothetical protein